MNRNILIVMGIVVLIGAGLLAGAGVTYVHQTTGTKAHAKVTGCTGSDSAHHAGVSCTGTWVTGGALIGGGGQVVVGDVNGAGYGDVGHTIAVRLHGGSAYTGGLGVPIILAILGLAIIGLAGWVILAVVTGTAGKRRLRTAAR